MTSNKNKGIAFDDYYRLVVAELIILGAEVNDEIGYPDEEEVKEDYENGKSHLICASEFFKNWKINHKIISKKTNEHNKQEQLNDVITNTSINNDSNNGSDESDTSQELPAEIPADGTEI